VSAIVLVTGGRNYSERNKVHEALAAISPALVVHGGCSGADLLAEKWCNAYAVPSLRFPADWTIVAKAGPMRNQAMVELVGLLWDASRTISCMYDGAICLAFPGGRGTEDCVAKAMACNIGIRRIK
jgi:hypothetical protein